MTPGRDYDESDVRIRPNRRGSRPRTKDRPAHLDAVSAFVVGVDRGRYRVLVGEGRDERPVTAMRARELTRTSIVVGVRVDLVGDTPADFAVYIDSESRKWKDVVRRSGARAD